MKKIKTKIQNKNSIDEIFCVIDIESQSACDISRGAVNYFADKSAKIICMSFAIVDNEGKVKTKDTVWTLDRFALPAPVKNHKGKFIAHSWFFEFSAFRRFAPETRLANPENWLCTQAAARRLGVSRRASLDTVCHALNIPTPKNNENRRLISTYSVPQADGKFLPISKEDKKLWLDYCASDVAATVEVWHKLSPHWSQKERDIFTLDCRLQARGLPVDVAGAKKLQKKLDTAKENAALRADEIAGRNAVGTLILSGRDEFLKFLKKNYDIKLENAQAATIAEFESENEISEELSEIFAVRSLLQSRATSKAQKIIDVEHYGRVHKWGEYHAAHTGRWQSWGVNFFNFSRNAVESSVWEKKLHEAKTVRDFAPLMRGLVCAPKGKTLITADWRGIENYLSLYFAGDVAQRARVEAGESPYLIFGEKLFGKKITKEDKKEYALAKAAVLGLGYGAGWATFKRIAKIQTGLELTDIEAKKIVNTWRMSNRYVVESWRRVERAFNAALNGQSAWWFRSPRKGLVVATLPSGYELRYTHAHRTQKGELACVRENNVQTLHGGKIWENLIQSTGRQLLCEAIERIEKHSVQVVMHVYDEIVCEAATPSAKKAAKIIDEEMRRAPDWAHDMKLDCEQKISKRWGK